MFVDVEQNTEEWQELRCANVGGSSIGKVMAGVGSKFEKIDCAFSDTAKKLAHNIAREEITRVSTPSSFSSSQLERGHIDEPVIVELYERETFNTVNNGGFFISDNIRRLTGSPDGITHDNGLIEVKSYENGYSLYQCKKRLSFDPAYKWQLYSNLLVSGFDYIDFVGACLIYPEDKKLFIHRIEKEECTEYFNAIEKRMYKFNQLIDEIKLVIEA